MSLPYEKNLIQRAKQLRKDATRQERHLWYDFLKSYPIRFQRQKTIGPYIVDFYCHSRKLVVELDGSQHFEVEGLQYDQRRTAFLIDLGLTVLRIPNIDVDRNFEAVCAYIDNVIQEAT